MGLGGGSLVGSGVPAASIIGRFGIVVGLVIGRFCAYSCAVASSTASTATIVSVLCMKERKKWFLNFISRCSLRRGRRRREGDLRVVEVVYSHDNDGVEGAVVRQCHVDVDLVPAPAAVPGALAYAAWNIAVQPRRSAAALPLMPVLTYSARPSRRHS